MAIPTSIPITIPTTNPSRSRQRMLYPALLLTLSGLLSACGGGGSSSEPASATDVAPPAVTQAETTPSPVTSAAHPLSASESVPESAIESAPTGKYTRDEIYPRVKSFPLQYVDTRQGHRIAVYVSLPANADGTPAEGPFPVILVQSAYNLSLTGAATAIGPLAGAPDPYLIKRGYAIVSADSMGTGLSGGGWELLGDNEQEAYADVAEWVKQQPWSNGKLGVTGVSYMGITGLFTAQKRPELVDAIFAIVPMGDSLRGTVGTGGMLNALFLGTWMVLTHFTTTQNIPAMLRYPQYWNTIAAHTREHVAQIDNYYMPLIQDGLDGVPYITYDSDFWRSRSPIENIDKVTAPTVIMGGLDDIFQRDAPLLYSALKRNTDARLIIYDGDHMTSNFFALSGGDKVTPLRTMLLQWFDHYLMGFDSGIEDIPPVTQYVKNYSSLLGRGYAITTDWPHPLAQPERWYLHGDNSLSRTAPETAEAIRSMETPPFADIDAYKSKDGNLFFMNVKMNDGTSCSPSFRQWTLGFGGFLKPTCSGDVRKLESTALNYESAPMEEDYYINGPIQADIWMETSAREAVLSVRVDVVNGRTGRVQEVSNGLLLASARAVNEQRSLYLNGQMVLPYHYFTQEAVQPVEPGEIMKMSVEIFSTSVLIRKGNKLRISLSPSNQAQGVLNNPRRELAKDGVTTIHHSPEFPSSVVVPVVPASELD